jgi:hypothetical protein
MRGKTWKLGAAVMIMGGALAGCGGPLKYAIHGSPKAPEIDATIVADVNKDGVFTSLKINIDHLAPPDRLGSGGKVFVVWAKDDKGKWQRVGALKYEGDARKASIEGASAPITAFDMKITVESDPAPEGPSGDTLLGRRIN